jgi:hypothetical protein
MTKTELKKYLAGIGRKGGSARSEAKRKAAAESLAKAREKRWPKKDLGKIEQTQ